MTPASDVPNIIWKSAAAARHAAAPVVELQLPRQAMRWVRLLISLPILLFGETLVGLAAAALVLGGTLAIGVFVGHRVSYALAAVLAFAWSVLVLKARDRAEQWIDDGAFLSGRRYPDARH